MTKTETAALTLWRLGYDETSIPTLKFRRHT